MTADIWREFFLWCTVIDIGILVWWFAFIVLAHDWVYEMHTRWFKLSPETFDAIHYGGLVAFKIIIWVFNIIPYIALWAIA